MLAYECRDIPLVPIPTRMMCELQGDATREDTTLHSAVTHLDYQGRVSSREKPQGEEVAPLTMLPTKVAAPKGVAAVGSNKCWPMLSPSTATLIPAHHPKAATSSASTAKSDHRRHSCKAPHATHPWKMCWGDTTPLTEKTAPKDVTIVEASTQEALAQTSSQMPEP